MDDLERLALLHYHVYQGTHDQVVVLLNEGVDPDGKNFKGQTPLMLAAERSHREIFEVLINSGADVHCFDSNDKTVLHYASCGGSVEIVECLLNRGIALNMMDSRSHTPLMMAADRKHKDVCELLMNSGANLNCCDCHGRTLLHYASSRGMLEVVQYLVSKGVAVDLVDIRSQTPLMMAAQKSHKEVFELLFKSGADIHRRDVDKYTLMHHAARGGSVEIAKCLLSNGIAFDEKSYFAETPLMLAAAGSHKEIVELFVDLGADTLCRHDGGWTVMHHASSGGSAEVVQYLVNKGIVLDQMSFHHTPLMCAIIEQHREVAEVLINSRANIHCFDDDGWTVLHHASHHGPLELVQCLESKGVSLDMMSCEGKTPLHLAIQNNQMAVADHLLKAGADCNLKDNKGESAFSCLIRKQPLNVEAVKLCIEKGAYFMPADNKIFWKDDLLASTVLHDVKVSSKAVINKFNNKDLPLLYEGHAYTQMLPHIEKMKIRSGSGVALEVERAVGRQIQAKGVCNVYKTIPSVLSMLCIKSSLEGLKLESYKKSLLDSQRRLKRIAYHTEFLPWKKKCSE